jgi:hypothetical protein
MQAPAAARTATNLTSSCFDQEFNGVTIMPIFLMAQ